MKERYIAGKNRLLKRQDLKPLLDYEVPIIDLISINQLRSENDGTKKPWSDVTKIKAPRIAPVRLICTASRVTEIVFSSTTRNKKNGAVHAEEIIPCSQPKNTED